MKSVKPPKKTVLVTGAAGFIGFHLTSTLLKAGVHVVGLDNFDPFYDPAIKQRNLADLEALARETGMPFEFHKMDLLELGPDSFPGKTFSQVVHLAAKAGVRPSLEDPEGYLRANVQGTLRVLEFCRDRKIAELCFASSSSVYGDDTPVPFRESAVADRPVSPYAASKRACELYCSTFAHLYGLKIAALRFFTVYGPRQRPDLAIHKFARLIAAGKPITLFGDGGTERDYTYVTDTIAGVTGAMEWVAKQPKGTFDTFNLGGSKTTSLKRLVELLEKNLRRPVSIRWEGAQPGDVQRTCADVSKAKDAFGYDPKIRIEDGMAKFIAWFEENQARPALKKAA